MDGEQSKQRPPYPPGTIRVGSIGGVDVLIRASWLLIAALLAYLFAPQVEAVRPGLGAWKYVAGLAFAILFYLTVLLHEAAHALMARHFGLPVRWITLHFLGGMTEIDGEPRTPGQEFKVAVVGPLTSIAVGLVALGLWVVVPDGLPRLAMAVLAWTNLVLGAINLVPGLPLDGGRVLRAAVWKGTDNMHRGTIVAAWGGRVLALLVLLVPVVLDGIGWTVSVLDYVTVWIVAAFLWSGATASMASARVRRRLPSLKARPLARRVIAVPDDLSVAEAVRRAQQEGAGAIVVHTADDRLSGIVNETALLATPDERRPWLPVSAVARTLEDGLLLPADIAGEELVRAMSRTPAGEYVLLEPDGSVYGVLSTEDVDRAFAEGARR
ncbi:MAG TPA: site-2 protease family protein [Marmoricola sp.]|nr:site-2 protease family protein [Marmoricola sp.]